MGLLRNVVLKVSRCRRPCSKHVFINRAICRTSLRKYRGTAPCCSKDELSALAACTTSIQRFPVWSAAPTRVVELNFVAERYRPTCVNEISGCLGAIAIYCEHIRNILFLNLQLPVQAGNLKHKFHSQDVRVIFRTKCHAEASF